MCCFVRRPARSGLRDSDFAGGWAVGYDYPRISAWATHSALLRAGLLPILPSNHEAHEGTRRFLNQAGFLVTLRAFVVNNNREISEICVSDLSGDFYQFEVEGEVFSGQRVVGVYRYAGLIYVGYGHDGFLALALCSL